MDIATLTKIANLMLEKGKGILAIDESHSTCAKRFEDLGVECTQETRREYRELLVSAPEIENSLSGMILFDETLRQSAKDGKRFVDILNAKGIMPGIKVDTGAKNLALHEGEFITEGLDGLRERLVEYRQFGAKFAKWRAVVMVSDSLPSDACVKANTHALARYAALCQESGLVPMVEPEIMMDGSHSIERCYEVTEQVLKALFAELKEQNVIMEATVLKVSMVIHGKKAVYTATPEQVAEMTVKCLVANVPANLAGVVFLSGGQSAYDSTIHLDLMNKIGGMPWNLSFSYGRGIQQPALEHWAMHRADILGAQKILVHRAKMNSYAALGQYSDELDKM